MGSSFGGMLLMMGGEEALAPLKETVYRKNKNHAGRHDRVRSL